MPKKKLRDNPFPKTLYVFGEAPYDEGNGKFFYGHTSIKRAVEGAFEDFEESPPIVVGVYRLDGIQVAKRDVKIGELKRVK